MTHISTCVHSVILGFDCELCKETSVKKALQQVPQPTPPCGGAAGSNKYVKRINSIDGLQSIDIDVYSVIEAYKITDPGQQHALKKILMPGQRGAKGYIADIKEAIASLKRTIVMAGSGE